MQNDSDQTDVSTKTEIAAERIQNALGFDDENVMARNWPSKDHDVILVTWEHDIVDGVNQYSKAEYIDKVYQSGANVQLHSSEDGDEVLTFKVRDEN